MLPKGRYEVNISKGEFVGFADLISNNGDGTVDIYDFKYSNGIDKYMKSGQLSIYKFFYGLNVKNLYFVFIPKIQIRQKKTEDLYQFRKRLKGELDKSQIKIVEVPYDGKKVDEFYEVAENILFAKEYPKHQSKLCDWCEYNNYCLEGIDYEMLLPTIQRRNIETIQKKVLWLYGSPFSGKTYLANKFPDPLMINTDGNIRFVDAPYIAIKDIVTVEGRITKRTLAWDVFKDVIAELEKKQNDFKTIVVDLLEDTYEHCRLYMYDQMGITHESDDSFRAWDRVRVEFLSTMKRLINLDYENIILISHEDTSKDITKKSGDKITSIRPNLQEKTANKIAGMVDIVARVIADGDERTLSFKSNEVIFGGGRLNVKQTTIPLDFEKLMKVYEEANAVVEPPKRVSSQPEVQKSEPEVQPETQTEQMESRQMSMDEVPVEPRTRKRREQ